MIGGTAKTMEEQTDPPLRKRPIKSMDPVFVTDEVVDMVADMLVKHARKHAIKREVANFVRSKYGLPPPTARTVETAIREARALLRAHTGTPIQDSKAAALVFYQDLASNDLLEASDRIKAQQRIDELLGHDFKYSDSRVSPADMAASIRQFIASADESVPTIEDNKEHDNQDEE